MESVHRRQRQEARPARWKDHVTPQASRTACRFAHPPAGGNTCGLAEPVPRCFWHSPRLAHFVGRGLPLEGAMNSRPAAPVPAGFSHPSMPCRIHP
ncbi:MAG: hypothetical protein EOP72_09540 [Variovorax sp.]|nr:MAG: hypothetical protein EOP72_09540 [Variovorax sp.]